MNHNENHSGFILIAIMILTFFIIVTGTATAQLTFSNLRAAELDTHRLNAQLAADAGLDDAIDKINQGVTSGVDWYGTAGSEIAVTTQSTYRTTYQALVTDTMLGGDDRKSLTVTGRTYTPASATTATSSRTYEVSLRPIRSSGNAVTTGVGGLFMENSSMVIGGGVVVNGRIDMNNSAQIGLSTQPIDVYVAHHSCPIGGGASYPSLCPPSAGQSITAGGTSWIYGTVRATNQTNGARMSSPGLIPGATASPLPLPTHDRAGQIAATTPNVPMSATAASCTNTGGTRTWPANTRITGGDVLVRRNCVVTVLGDVWIEGGSLSLIHSGSVRPQNGLTVRPTIMVDGDVTASNQSGFHSNNNPTPLGFRVISYRSSAACSPNCADVTGVDLYNSRNLRVIALDGLSQGPNTEFYARWSEVYIANSGGVGSAIGQTVHLDNTATIAFSGDGGTGGSIVGWVVESYRRQYTPL